MNITLSPQQLNDLQDLVSRLTAAAKKQWRTQPEKVSKSVRTYEGILEFAADAALLTDNQIKVIVTGAKMLKQTAPLWLLMEAANTTGDQILAKPTVSLDLDKVGLDLPPYNTEPQVKTPDIDALLEGLAQYIVQLEQRINQLERKLTNNR